MYYDTVGIMHEIDFWEAYETFVKDLKESHSGIDDIYLSNLELTYDPLMTGLTMTGKMYVSTSETYEVCQQFGYRGSFDIIYAQIVAKLLAIVIRIFPEIWENHG